MTKMDLSFFFPMRLERFGDFDDFIANSVSLIELMKMARRNFNLRKLAIDYDGSFFQCHMSLHHECFLGCNPLDYLLWIFDWSILQMPRP